MLPADFDVPSRDIALLVPFAFTPAQMSDTARGNEFSQMIARLRTGATIDQVNAQIRRSWIRTTIDCRRVPSSRSETAAGLTSNVPFNGNVSSGSYSIVGYTPSPNDTAPHGRQEVVGGDYFRAMRIGLLEGRVFNDGDTADSTPVVVVDRYLANRYFAGRSALGHLIQRGGPTSPKLTIVGVVGTINSIDLAQP